MDIHKPKPIRNWREFLKEVGIIVLGVSIALAAEQAVEWFHWRGEAAKANESIATELSFNLQGAIQRLRAEKCVEARLDILSTLLDEAVKTGNLPPLGAIGSPPNRLWRNGVWENAISSQVITHFSRERQTELASVYKVVERLTLIGAEERAAWDDLYALVGPGRRIDPYAENLRQALSRARGLNRVGTSLSMQMVTRVHDLRPPFSKDDLARIDAAKSQPALNLVTIGDVRLTTNTCDAIGPAPTSYGQGQLGVMPAQMDRAVKAIPDFSGGAR